MWFFSSATQKKTPTQQARSFVSEQKKGLASDKRKIAVDINKLETSQKQISSRLRALVASSSDKEKINSTAQELATVKLRLQKKRLLNARMQNCETRMDDATEIVQTAEMIKNTTACDRRVNQLLNPKRLQAISIEAQKQTMISETTSDLIEEIMEDFAEKDADEESQIFEETLKQIYADFSIGIEEKATIPSETPKIEINPSVADCDEWDEIRKRLDQLRDG